MRSFSLLALAAPLVAAMDFSSPAANTTLAKGETFQLSWNTVDTDPSQFSVYLVNFVNWPPYYAPLAYNVETSSGEIDVKLPCNIDNSYGYQFNAINGTNVYVIYAQTPKFFVTGGPCEDAPTPEPTCEAATTTLTVTVSTTLVSGGLSVVTIPPTAHSSAPAPGRCPDTIGWSSGYNHPVTLSKVPEGPKPTAAPLGAFKSKEFEATSTIYQTVYKDISEVDELCQC
ncbi:Ser-Thr-rich glycosyl-phosphatidyl-inositol-anchored membrane family-domain-containing protein [Podospora aff. communis PSN243]|uniref:Ser-Thr-rich glycosyl-phosphatidyl-inositol-anchored membrane family-domain-containing protein n=1 Tax=Podospora aff. communis PSN243 TaxID=3040156 RepID=A0AAV9GTR5_9PEZI|nr:Ser-Thr-rich glycosyl-phosphatidyl-inositol-anchored membrane family-domain-containing protein [Podospora aff. communis PSN243]